MCQSSELSMELEMKSYYYNISLNVLRQHLWLRTEATAALYLQPTFLDHPLFTFNRLYDSFPSKVSQKMGLNSGTQAMIAALRAAQPETGLKKLTTEVGNTSVKTEEEHLA